MGGALGDDGGGIQALGDLIHRHPGELRHLLISSGLRWRDHGRTWDWADLAVLVRFAPPDAPISRRLAPEGVWSQSEYMLADLFDAIRHLGWNGRGSRPKPDPRPGDRTVQKFGTKRMGLAEAQEFLARRRRGEA